jgi:hypothetical protein
MANNDSKVAGKNDLPHDGVMSFVSKVKGICDGVGAVLALNYAHEGERLEANDLAPETTLSMIEMESLMTLARASMGLLENEAVRMQRWAESQHTDGGILEAYRAAKANVEHHDLTATAH